MQTIDLPTPALVIDQGALDRNIATMGARWPGTSLRPHIKAFKSTELAARLRAAGHSAFCCATPAEIMGMAGAGLGDDLLLANETIDPDRLVALATMDRNGVAQITIAVDSDATIDAAIAAGIQRVLIDVNVGLPRCGCLPADAGRLADRARAGGIEVRGVMGYEGHVTIIDDAARRQAEVERSMELLLAAHIDVGGPIISAGSTVDWDQNTWATELQAGTFVLMDTAFASMGLPFEIGLRMVTTVISVSEKWAVCDGGLKSLGMDHGNPAVDRGEVFIVSDEHITFLPSGDAPVVGDRVLVTPAHLDPTVARHEVLWVADGPELEASIIDQWPIDLRHW